MKGLVGLVGWPIADGLQPTVLTCETKRWNGFRILSVSYFTRNHVRNWNEIISATWHTLPIIRNEPAKYNFEIISGKFLHAEITKLFQTDVDKGRNNGTSKFLVNLLSDVSLLNDGRSIMAVWFKLTVTVTEMTINWNKSNPLTVTVTVTEKFH